MSFIEKGIKFQVPFGLMLGGASSSGKTTFIMEFIQKSQQLIEPPPKKVIYCYGEFGEHILQLQEMGIETVDGPPDNDLIENTEKPFLLIIDDLMLSIDENFLSAIFTRKIHH